ncbi:MAG: hypothetical protein Q9220_001599 [cf. Caloplaca sp. 1 TL-2023]
MNIFFPYLFGALFAGCVSRPVIPPTYMAARSLLLFVAAFVLRSGGCTWNDIVDRDIDRLVERTRARPMARRAIGVKSAYVFTAIQSAVWLTLLWQLVPEYYASYGLPLLFFVWLYPFAKRFMDYAQLVLGITLSWGVLIGSAALGLDIMKFDSRSHDMKGLLGLYVVYTTWTVIHDTIYAHQDVRDDIKAGIRSMAVRWFAWTKPLLCACSLLQVGSLCAAGVVIRAGIGYYLGAVGGSTIILAWMICSLDLTDPGDCAWWFQTGSMLIGISITSGLGAEYVAKGL